MDGEAGRVDLKLTPPELLLFYFLAETLTLPEDFDYGEVPWRVSSQHVYCLSDCLRVDGAGVGPASFVPGAAVWLSCKMVSSEMSWRLSYSPALGHHTENAEQ